MKNYEIEKFSMGMDEDGEMVPGTWARVVLLQAFIDDDGKQGGKVSRKEARRRGKLRDKLEDADLGDELELNSEEIGMLKTLWMKNPTYAVEHRIFRQIEDELVELAKAKVG